MIKVLGLSRNEQKKLLKLNEEEEYGDPWFVEVVTLTTGQSFGELALLNDANRAATITCKKDCYFATIGRDEYEKVLKRIEQKNQQKTIAFFKSLPFLQHWTNGNAHKVSLSFSEKVFQRN